MRILVIDDSAVARSILRSTLAEIGYRDVTEAENGLDAALLVSKRAFDLILCDWHMPAVDGPGFLEAVRQTPARGVPVIMVSSETYSTRIDDALRAGAQGFVTKPFDKKQLKSAIDRVRFGERGSPRVYPEATGSDKTIDLTTLVDAVQRTFAKVLGLEVRLLGRTLARAEAVPCDLSGVVTVTGTGRQPGQSHVLIVISFPDEVARRIAARLPGQKAAAPSESSVIDVVGELTNVVVGVARQELEKQGMRECEASLPRVVPGSKVAARRPGTIDSFTSAFACELGEFRLELAFRKGAAPQR